MLKLETKVQTCLCLGCWDAVLFILTDPEQDWSLKVLCWECGHHVTLSHCLVQN